MIHKNVTRLPMVPNEGKTAGKTRGASVGRTRLKSIVSSDDEPDEGQAAQGVRGAERTQTAVAGPSKSAIEDGLAPNLVYMGLM